MIFDGLDDIPWGELTYAHRGDCDVPALVRSLLVEEEAFAAADELLNELFHQGDFVCTAAPAILPFLVEAAGSPRVVCRPAVLEIIVLLAGTAAEVAPRWLALEWPRAWTRARPGLLALLADGNPAVRTAAIRTLGDDVDDPDEVARALLAEWPDPDVSVRTDTLLALGHLAKRLSAAVLPETLLFLREQADGADVHHAMYAALALAKALPGRPIGPAPILAGLAAGPVALPHSTFAADDPADVARTVLLGLDGPGGDAVRLALLASPDQRLRAGRHAHPQARARPAHRAARVRGGLDDPARALAILAAHARREDAPDADLMAAHLDGSTAFGGRDEPGSPRPLGHAVEVYDTNEARSSLVVAFQQTTLRTVAIPPKVFHGICRLQYSGELPNAVTCTWSIGYPTFGKVIMRSPTPELCTVLTAPCEL
ncbi:hypothetical protein [Herbidospora sp. NBRC 101105]|uniref:HEAT repeat domain-containing protein n=1 Tax=Herbidospora sp. NBRC 101105 TaxID=3032195 RepID=UPI0024A3DAB7|nr:hypothetical protein [Herbidospora sp. NBRC 101105]GLX97127.1 hypothetical protein Hesp01_50770 [Herbidospora sp. NBRC 101105]